jgi:hypothetical protein
MSQLDPGQRAEMEDLLGELSALGVPVDPSLLKATMPPDALRRAVDVHSGSARTEALKDAPRAALRDAPANLVCQVLAAEPDRLIGLVLAQHDWPWTEPLLVHVGPERRQHILDAFQETVRRSAQAPEARGAALADALLLGLERRIAALVKSVHAFPGPSRHHPRLARFLSRWIDVMGIACGSRGRP